MDNKLSELSKPVAWTDERGNLCTNRIKERGLESRYHQDYEKYTKPFYSQEYVSALLAELEASKKYAKERDAENESLALTVGRLRAELATPVQLQNCDFESVAVMAHWCTDEQLEAWVKGVEHAKKQIRAAGFKCVGDE